MEAYFTANIFPKREEAQSTEKVFLGRQFEKAALSYCLNLQYKVLFKNRHFKCGEIDLFARDLRRNRYILIEVRGKRKTQFLPSRTLSAKKIRTLKTLAAIMQRKCTAPVHIELFEVVGEKELSIRIYKID